MAVTYTDTWLFKWVDISVRRHEKDTGLKVRLYFSRETKGPKLTIKKYIHNSRCDGHNSNTHNIDMTHTKDYFTVQRQRERLWELKIESVRDADCFICMVVVCSSEGILCSIHINSWPHIFPDVSQSQHAFESNPAYFAINTMRQKATQLYVTSAPAISITLVQRPSIHMTLKLPLCPFRPLALRGHESRTAPDARLVSFSAHVHSGRRHR